MQLIYLEGRLNGKPRVTVINPEHVATIFQHGEGSIIHMVGGATVECENQDPREMGALILKATASKTCEPIEVKE